METIKIWVVTGAMDGLGPAAVKYLLARHQIVVVISLNSNSEQFGSLFDTQSENLKMVNLNPNYEEIARNSMNDLIEKHGFVDFLINNCGYGLINDLKWATPKDIGLVTSQNLDFTMYMVKFVLPYMKSNLDGHIISMPPKQFLIEDSCKPVYGNLSMVVEEFSEHLYAKLNALGVKLTFMKPGDRMPNIFCP
jgi:NADP-dependent 3-hydroxy acid dehydrogenase YdfG